MACASRTVRTTNRGRWTGKGGEREKARGPLSSRHTTQCKRRYRSLGVERPREQSGFQGRGERAATPHPWRRSTAGGRAGSSLSDSGRPRSPRVPAAGPDLDAEQPASLSCPTATARHVSWAAVRPPQQPAFHGTGPPGSPCRLGAGRGRRRAGNMHTGPRTGWPESAAAQASGRRPPPLPEGSR